MNNKLTGAFIRQRRKELSLNQKQLADKLGVTDKAVSKWETGRSAPDISLLIPLSEVLGVSVAEMLKGEKIEEEKLSAVSDEIVVSTMKKGRKKVFCAVLIVLLLVALVLLSYPIYHFSTSVPIDNKKAIERELNNYLGKLDESHEDMKIVKSVKKGDYFFFLLQNETETHMSYCRRDEFFKSRISALGCGGCSTPNEVILHCAGVGYETINVFYGYDMTDTEYSYIYRGVECTKPIEDELLLDVFIDINDSWTHASIVYD